MTEKAKLELGDTAEHSFTLYRGYVHGLAQYLGGVEMVQIWDRGRDQNGRPTEPVWFDAREVRKLPAGVFV